MNKSGLVFKVQRKTVVIITQTGEFVEVMIGNDKPQIGERFTGTVVKRNNNIKKILLAAAALLVFLSSGSAYAYYTPVATVDVEINPSIEVKVNRFDRIIAAEAKNEDGQAVLDNLNLNNYKLEDGLIQIVEEARNEKFINDDYIAEGKTIKINIKDSKSSYIAKVDNFKEYIENQKLNTNLVNNGEETKMLYNKNEKSLKVNNDNSNSTNEEGDKEQPKEEKSNNTSGNSSDDKNSNKENSQNPTNNKVNENKNTNNNNNKQSEKDKEQKGNSKK
jgi:hypothetical protein